MSKMNELILKLVHFYYIKTVAHAFNVIFIKSLTQIVGLEYCNQILRDYNCYLLHNLFFRNALTFILQRKWVEVHLLY